MQSISVFLDIAELAEFAVKECYSQQNSRAMPRDPNTFWIFFR